MATASPGLRFEAGAGREAKSELGCLDEEECGEGRRNNQEILWLHREGED